MIKTTNKMKISTDLRLLVLINLLLSMTIASNQASAQGISQTPAGHTKVTQSSTSPTIQPFIQSNKCFDSVTIEASFLAFTTAKNSSLANWYQQLFKLNTVKEFAFPDGKTTGILMNKNNFIVEVFFKQDLIIPEKLVPQSKGEQWQGVNKVGLFTNADLPRLKQCLNQAGVNATRIWHDKNLAIDLLQVIDPDGNVLEIIAPIQH